MEKITVYEAYIAQNGASMTTWIDADALKVVYDSISKTGVPFTVWANQDGPPPTTTSLTIVPSNGGVTFHVASYATTDVLYYDGEMKRVGSEQGAAGKMTAGEHAKSLVTVAEWHGNSPIDKIAGMLELGMAAFAAQQPEEAAKLKEAVEVERAKAAEPTQAPEKPAASKSTKK